MTGSASYRILLVEDVDLMARIYGERLIAVGHHVDRARTGRDALGLCAAARYDVVLLDLTLPDMTGLEIINRLRNDFPQGAPPVIVLTNAVDPREWDAALAAGARRVLAKSASSPDDVAEAVSELLA
jgi:CheY-like chemotaxis protein